MRGFLRLLLAAGVIGALWVLLRELLDDSGTQTPSGESGAGGAESQTQPEAQTRSNGASSPSKAELYREAQRLDVEGRSKMTKDELAAAIAAAR